MELIYNPFIGNLPNEEWGVCEDESKKEYLSFTQKFTLEVSDAIKLMSPGQELFKLEDDDKS